MLIARPVSVAARLLPFRTPRRQQAFIPWAGLRGAVPIVLATFAAAVDDSRHLLSIVFLLVVFTLVQGPPLPAAARLHGVAVFEPRQHRRR
ncbi:cation:proton antiporter [Streptomyces wedmorensis]|uniref:Cation:proton antiporter n=1 Tax=Streptomyces wedmorensis TaxID=43759 RepID=A0ABW6J728_STRWE